MEKDFDGWNIKKKAIDSNSKRAFCYKREVWWCSLGINVGSEQNGKGNKFGRPVIVIRGFNENIFLAVALTSQKKTGKFYFPLGFISGKESFAILSQIRLIDAKRLIKKITILDEKSFEGLKNALRGTLFN